MNPWYFRKADGTHRTPDWVVFWYGMSSWSDIDACIQRALSIPPSISNDNEDTNEPAHVEPAGAVIAAGV